MPGRIRTSGLWSRSPTLYPAELRAQVCSCQFLACNHRSRSPTLYPAELQAHAICCFLIESCVFSERLRRAQGELYHRFLLVAIGDRLANGRYGYDLQPVYLRSFVVLRQNHGVISEPDALVEPCFDAAHGSHLAR